MSNIDLSDIDLTSLVDHKFDPSEVTTTEKLVYGADDETMIGGNILRYGSALVDSMFDSSVTFDDALKSVNNKRQRDVFQRNPKFFGIDPEQEDAATIAGRMGTAITDPVTWLIPWAKVDKIGRTGATAFGASFAAGDAALRDKLIYGDVDPLTVGISAAIGGGTGFLSSSLAQRFSDAGRKTIEKASKNPERVAPEADDVSQVIPTVIDEQAAQETMPSMNSVIKAYQRQKWWALPEPIEVSSTSPMRDLVRAHNRRMAGYRQPLAEKDQAALETATLKLTDTKKIDERIEQTSGLAYVTQPIQEARKTLDALQKRLDAAKPEDVAELRRLRDAAQVKVEKAQKKYFDTQLETQLTKADTDGAILEELNNNGDLTKGIMAKVLYEGTRPVVGALGGYAASGIVGDEDDDALTLGFMLAGAYIGRRHNLLQKSNLTSVQKADGALMIDDGAGRNIRTMVKMHSAGALSTQLDAMGGYAKIIGNMLFQRPGAATDTVEARVFRNTRKFMSELNSTLGDAADDVNTRKLLGQMINGFDVENIKVGYKGIAGDLDPVTAEQIASAKRLTPLLAKLRDDLAKTVKDVGIAYPDLGDNYGMAQLYNLGNIRENTDEFYDTLKQALRLQLPKAKEADINRKADEIFKSMTGVQEYSGKTVITKDTFFDGGKFRPLTEHFEKHRLITSPAARKLLAQKGYINMDAQEVFSIYADRTIKGVEFAKTFGPNGEFIEYSLNKIDDAFKAAGPNKKDFGEEYKKYILSSLDAFWGTYGADKAGSKSAQLGLSLLTTLANSTFLTRVTISSLGDLIQPFQNSGFAAGAKGIMGKLGSKPSFSQQANFKYDNSFEREFSALMAQGGDPLSNFQHNINTFNKKFFQIVQLERLTNFARGFAYDVGVNRAFDISRKKTVGTALKKEMETMGLSNEDISTLNKYKTVQDAFDSDDGNAVLDRVGQKMADRDAIIPMVGNRRLFTQSRNPYVRSLGQFLSWAQAKSAQTNSLIERVENGDAALAIRTLGLTGVYAGVQGLREISSPSYDPHADKYTEDIDGLIQLSKKSMELSGNYMPWQIDKLLRVYESSSRGNFLSGLTPTASYAEKFVDTLMSAGRNIQAGDPEGALQDFTEVTPFAREIIGYGERLGFDMPEDRPNKAKGGVITGVPNVPTEPDERIDKMTGQPYDQQAGTAFVDEEDPLRRLGFKGGGEVDPLKRLGFGLGSLVARQASRVIRNVDEAPVKTEKQLEADFDDLTQALDKGETPKMFEEPTANITEPKKSEDYLSAINMKEEDIAAWQEANKLPESKRQKQRPEVIQSLQKVLAGKKTVEDHNKLIDEVFPPFFYTKENAPEFPTLVEVRGAVGKKTLTGGRGIIDADVSVEEGRRVSSRLDIPAYDQRGVWAVTLHEPGKSGKAFAYGQSAILKNVEFTTNPKDALDIAMGQAKGTIARIEGDWVNHDSRKTYTEALELLNSDEWVQVGMNPYKHSYFYDKATMKPLKSASEVIQVGPLVLAKKDKKLIYAEADDFKVDLSSESIKGKKKLRDQEINIDSVSFMEGGKVLKVLARGKDV